MKRIIKLFPKPLREKLKRYLNISPMKKLDLEKICFIKDIPKESLLENKTLEKLIVELGLNDDELFNYPRKLHKYAGNGLLIWQYPNQLSKYLIHLSKYKIESYLEIGVKHGGTFILTNEFLKRFNNIKKSIAVDLFPIKGLIIYKRKNKEVKTFVADSHSESFAKFIKKNEPLDLVLIDGDHSYEGCKSDFELLKNYTNIIVLHDIVGGGVPGVGRVWAEIRLEYDKHYNFYEFTDQYEDVINSTSMTWLGIGVAVKKEFDIVT